MNEKSGGSRYNSGKLRWSLLSIPALSLLAEVLEMGAKKYDAWNWSKGLSWTETYDSLQRHATKWLAGEDKDPESGLSHMAHVLCNAMFLVHFILTRTGTDDRPSAQKLEEPTEGKIEQREEPIRVYQTTGIGVTEPLRTHNPVESGGVSHLQAHVRPAVGGLWQNGGMDGYGTACTECGGHAA